MKVQYYQMLYIHLYNDIEQPYLDRNQILIIILQFRVAYEQQPYAKYLQQHNSIYKKVNFFI